MKLQEFLSAIVPTGLIVVAQKVERLNDDGKPYGAVSHKLAKSHAQATQVIKELSKRGVDVYYAMASYTQGFHPNPKEPSKKQLRVRTNVAALKALWIDIDFKGAKGKPPKYPDAQSAVQALKVFCQAAPLPAPTILVGSGNGLHAYWPMDAAIPLDDWQKLADALKAAAVEHGLEADLGCTADACRILRPPGTYNWKDPDNPKLVRLLHDADRTYPYQQLADALEPWMVASKKPLNGHAKLNGHDAYNDLTGGLGGGGSGPYNFEAISQQCGIAKHAVDTHGQDASEPEWTALLQILKFCEDGPLWVHPVSDGHQGYDPAATDKKFAQRVANTAAPTKCSTFEALHPSICAACPHNGKIKSPLHLGREVQAAGTPIDDLPPGWRVAADRSGMEHQVYIPPAKGDKGEGVYEWAPVLRHIISGLKSTRMVSDKTYECTFDVQQRSSQVETIQLATGTLGNLSKLNEYLASKGMVLYDLELKPFKNLMTTWLSKIQNAKSVADVTEQLGWIKEEGKLIGFSCGPTTFYADGRVRNDVRADKDYLAVSKHYEPQGSIEPWKRVAGFIADQDNPALTAILASAFAAPILRFTGVPGAVLSIVSSASGVGKSSVLRCAQAVWGSPPHGVNATSDTPLSVQKKLGFLSNLPAYWDEVRGDETVARFVEMVFTVTSGKDKGRLNSRAEMREVQTWETLLVVASNSSIFEAMGRLSGDSDAGSLRTYEMVIQRDDAARDPAANDAFFSQVNRNYGHAGRIFAQYLATHADDTNARVQKVHEAIQKAGQLESQERFWHATIVALIVGAQIASELGLVNINIRTLSRYLLDNLATLRSHNTGTMESYSSTELLATFMSEHKDRELLLEFYPPAFSNGKKIPPTMLSVPKRSTVAYSYSQSENIIRFSMSYMKTWLQRNNRPVGICIDRLTSELHGTVKKTRVSPGTSFDVGRQLCMEIKLPFNPNA